MDSNEGDRMPQQKKQQQEFDFERTDQLALIDFAQLPSVRTRDRSVSGAVLKEVLRVIDAHAGRRGSCYASVETIKLKTSRGTNTIKRACEALRRLGIVKEWKRRDGKHWQYHRKILWPKLAEFVDLDQLKEGTRAKVRAMLRESTAGDPQPETDLAEGPTVGPSADELRVPLCTFEGPTVDFEGPTVDVSGSHRGYDKVLLNYRRNSPPTPAPPPADRRTALNRRWGAVVELLRQQGVTQGPSLVRTARQAGAEPADIEAGILHYARHARAAGWTPGALGRWIREWTPNATLDDHWPPRRHAGREQTLEVASVVGRLKALEARRIEAAVSELLPRSEHAAAHFACFDMASPHAPQVLEPLARAMLRDPRARRAVLSGAHAPEDEPAEATAQGGHGG